METIKKIANQTGFQLTGKLISSAVTLFSLSLITNYYGTEGTGLYTLILTYLAFFYLAADLGLNAYALPLLGKSDQLFSKVLGFRLFLGVGLAIVALSGSVFVADQTGEFFLGVLFGVISILGNAAFVTANLFFQKNLRYDFSVLAASITTVLSGLLIWLMVLNGFSIAGLLIATSLCWLICALLSLLLVKRYVQVRAEIDFKFIKQTLIQIWPLSATLLLNVFYFRIDTFLLNYFRTLSEVGIYNFAYQFFQTALVLPTFIMNALYPLLLEKKIESKSTIRRFIFYAFLIMTGIGFIGSLVTWTLSPFIINLVAYNGGFESSVVVLRILGLSFPAFFGSAVLMWSLVTFQLNRLMLLVYFIGLIVNLLLNIWLIPEYSFLAAAWVTVICEYLILLLQIVILYYYFSRHLRD